MRAAEAEALLRFGERPSTISFTQRLDTVPETKDPELPEVVLAHVSTEADPRPYAICDLNSTPRQDSPGLGNPRQFMPCLVQNIFHQCLVLHHILHVVLVAPHIQLLSLYIFMTHASPSAVHRRSPYRIRCKKLAPKLLAETQIQNGGRRHLELILNAIMNILPPFNYWSQPCSTKHR